MVMLLCKIVVIDFRMGHCPHGSAAYVTFVPLSTVLILTAKDVSKFFSINILLNELGQAMYMAQ